MACQNLDPRNTWALCVRACPFIHDLVSQRFLNYSKWCQSWKWNQINCSQNQNGKEGKMNGFSTCASHGRAWKCLHLTQRRQHSNALQRNVFAQHDRVGDGAWAASLAVASVSLLLMPIFLGFVHHASVCWKRVVIIMINMGCFVYMSASVKCYLQNIWGINLYCVFSAFL